MLLHTQSHPRGQTRPLAGFSRRLYMTYPHANGFLGNGEGLVLGQRNAEEYRLWLHDVATGDERILKAWPRRQCSGDMLWFDVSAGGGFLVAVVDNALWRVELVAVRDGGAALLYREPPDSGHVLVPLPSVSSDGRRVVVGRRLAGGRACEVLEIDTVSGGCMRLATFPAGSNHFHLCPGDEAWLGYCREGSAETVGIRVWGWNATLAPLGRPLLDNGAIGLHVGHERWALHAASVFVVAYGVSPRGPRGVYELFPDGRPARLVSEGDRDWHVGASADGRWLAVDTTGPHDAPGRGWEDAGTISDVLVIEVATGRRRFAARSRRAAEFHCHPHPVFSPDGRMVFFNEAAPGDEGHRVVAVCNPWVDDAIAEPAKIF